VGVLLGVGGFISIDGDLKGLKWFRIGAGGGCSCGCFDYLYLGRGW